MPISPGIQQMQNVMAGQTSQSAQEFFEKAFSDMAYAALQSKMPTMLSSVVTFRIMESDVENNFSIGAFVLSRNTKISYIPVVLSENKIKPLEIVYSKSLSKFFPLTDSWVREIHKIEDAATVDFGQPADLPPSMPRDVSLAHMQLPNTHTGRFVHASATDLLGEMLVSDTDTVYFSNKLSSMLESMTMTQTEALMEKIVGTSAKVAETYLNIFDGPKGIGEYFLKGLKEEKVASTPEKLECEVLLPSDSPARFKEVFQEKAASAFTECMKEGFVVSTKNEHLLPELSISMEEKTAKLRDNVGTLQPEKEKPERKIQYHGFNFQLHYPMKTGFYRVYKSDGTSDEVFVVRKMNDKEEFPQERMRRWDSDTFIIVKSDGSFCTYHESAITGTPLSVPQAQNSDVYKFLAKQCKNRVLKAGYGIFVSFRNSGHLECSDLANINQVFESNGEQIGRDAYHGHEYILSNKSGKRYETSHARIKPAGRLPMLRPNKFREDYDYDPSGFSSYGKTTKNKKQIFFGKEYCFIPLTRESNSEGAAYLESPKAVSKVLDNTLEYATRTNFELKYDKSTGQYVYIDGKMFSPSEAMKHLVKAKEITPEKANTILKKASESNTSKVWEIRLFDTEGLRKIASLFGPSVQPLEMAMEDPMAMQGQMGMEDPMAMQGQMGMEEQMYGPQQTGYTTGDVLEVAEMNPEFQDDPSMLEDPDLLNMAHLDVIVRSPTLKDIVNEYQDVLLQSLDHIGRILFAMYVKSRDLKDEIGNIQYAAVERAVENLFKSFGDTLLELHQNSALLTNHFGSVSSQTEADKAHMNHGN